MRICIVTPAPPRSQHGNRVTAIRWARVLRSLGHRVNIQEAYAGSESCDVLIALHAKRSAEQIKRYREVQPGSPLVLALTGTDLYRDIERSAAARDSLALADRLVLLQAHGLTRLGAALQNKCHVIYQSAQEPRSRPKRRERHFEVVVIGHLRPVKDPFRTALAVRRVPESSRIQVVHLGGSMSPSMERRAQAEMDRNSRYRWLGERPRSQTLQRLARARLLVLTSKMEGGANVVSEALACSTPILSTRVSGSIGLLGEDYRGFFEVGDTAGLADLLCRAETDHCFYQAISDSCSKLRTLVDPERERAGWAELLAEVRG